MDKERIQNLYTALVSYTKQYPQTWGQLQFQPTVQHHIANDLIHISDDVKDEQPYISKALVALKDNLFTPQWTPNMTTYAEVMLTLDILLHTDDPVQDSCWNYIHPRIVASSQKLYDDGHYANAAVDAFIEINDRVKQLYKRLEPNGKILDGQALMNRVFSDEKPLLEICDRTVESGNDIHNGVRSMLAGAMSAFRNPKAHANVSLDAAEAMRQLMFASTLMYKIDAAVKRAGLSEN